MTARDPDVLIQAFLTEGPVDLPDSAFDVLRADMSRTHQRVVIGPWRNQSMPLFARVAIAAAALLLVAVALSLGGVGGTPAPTPTPVPTPSPVAIGPEVKTLDPGRYRVLAGTTQGAVPISFAVPAGWSSWGGISVDKNYPTATGAALMVWRITNAIVDPCMDHAGVVPEPGPGVDPLVSALAAMPGIRAGQPTEVTVDGFRGKSIELTVTTDIGTCAGGLYVWMSPDDAHFVQDTGEMDRVYVLDAGGERVTFEARFSPQTTAADAAELEAIIQSIDIER